MSRSSIRHLTAVVVTIGMFASGCEIGGHAEAEEPFRITSLIRSTGQTDAQPHLADDLSRDLTMVLSPTDASAVRAPTEIQYSAVSESVSGTRSTGLDIDTDLLISVHDGSFRFCLADDVIVRENNTGREHVLVPAGTCTERTTATWDATASFT